MRTHDSVLSVTVTCRRCGIKVDGHLFFDARNHLSDSAGFIVWGNDAVCDDCLGGSARTDSDHAIAKFERQEQAS